MGGRWQEENLNSNLPALESPYSRKMLCTYVFIPIIRSESFTWSWIVYFNDLFSLLKKDATTQFAISENKSFKYVLHLN